MPGHSCLDGLLSLSKLRFTERPCGLNRKKSSFRSSGSSCYSCDPFGFMGINMIFQFGPHWARGSSLKLSKALSAYTQHAIISILGYSEEWVSPALNTNSYNCVLLLPRRWSRKWGPALFSESHQHFCSFSSPTARGIIS